MVVVVKRTFKMEDDSTIDLCILLFAMLRFSKNFMLSWCYQFFLGSSNIKESMPFLSSPNKRTNKLLKEIILWYKCQSISRGVDSSF